MDKINVDIHNFQDDSNFSMTKQENEYVRTLNLSPEMEALVKYPTYTDLCGVVNNWTNIDEGWYPMRRYKYLSRIQDINIQRKNIRRFTELGYKGAFHLLVMIKKILKYSSTVFSHIVAVETILF